MITKGKIFSNDTLALRLSGYYPCEKRWITAALGAASLVSSLIGGSASRKAQERALAEQRKANDDERALLLRKKYEDYLDTAAGQNLVRKARELSDRQVKQARGAAAMGGGTDAAVALAKQGANKVVSDAIAEIGARDTARKDQIDTQLAANTRRRGDINANAEIAKGQATAQVAGAASNALATGAAISAGMGASKSGTANTGASESTTGSSPLSPIDDLNDEPSWRNGYGTPWMNK